jgi:hypothetical protein
MAGDLTEGLELRCSLCRAIADACSVCGMTLNVGEVRCVHGEHHHAGCETAHRRKRTIAADPERRRIQPARGAALYVEELE